MKKIFRIIVLFILVFVSVSFFSANKNNEYFDLGEILSGVNLPVNNFIQNYDLFLKENLGTTNNVGAAVAVVTHDSVIFLKPYGLKKIGTNDSVDIHTLFRLASVSKGFAGVLTSLLDEKELLSLDDKIVDYLPEFKLKDSVNTYNLTVKHTLNHTSGLVPHAFDNLVEANIPMAEIISRLSEVDIAAEPGNVYGYQNAVFSLIDTILKSKYHKNYNAFINEYIFVPLKMKDASVDFISFSQNPNIAYPHGISKGKYITTRLNDGYYNVSPAAGVNASISDMSIWLKALLGYKKEIIDLPVLNNIITPLVYTPLKQRYTVRWGKVDNRQYSLGWRIYSYQNREILYHGGYVRGYRAEIAFCPEEKTGIVFLQNSPNSLAAMSIPEFWNQYFVMVDSLKATKFKN